MTKKLTWRLQTLPTPQEVIDLTQAGLLTEDEAKDILYKIETDEERDNKSLQEEIKFLRTIIDKLSNNQSTKIIETIREVERPYVKYAWIQPYSSWCTTPALSQPQTSLMSSASNDAMYTASAGIVGKVNTSFSSIQTF